MAKSNPTRVRGLLPAQRQVKMSPTPLGERKDTEPGAAPAAFDSVLELAA